MNVKAFINTISTKAATMPVVILYVTEGCNLRCMTCSYRAPLPDELTVAEIEQLAGILHDFGLRHIVYSGGEPLMRRDFPAIGEIFRRLGVRQTLLTNGLLLEKRFPEVRGFLNEIIVSVDGPSSPVHDQIRGAESFDRIVSGIRAARRQRGEQVLSLRTVVQRRNFRSLPDIVPFARELGVDRISFLAADTVSSAFGREHAGPAAPDSSIRLDAAESAEFRGVVAKMIDKYAEEFRAGFISDPPWRLEHIANYFEALSGNGPFPGNDCNAPMMSTVITSTGDVLPCYFLPPYANVRSGSLRDLLNTPSIRRTRGQVRAMALERCKTCVCTLRIGSRAAFLDRF